MSFERPWKQKLHTVDDADNILKKPLMGPWAADPVSPAQLVPCRCGHTKLCTIGGINQLYAAGIRNNIAGRWGFSFS
jgi:hypothetical protein